MKIKIKINFLYNQSETGQDMVLPEPTSNPSRIFKEIFKPTPTHLFKFQTRPIMGGANYKTCLIDIPTLTHTYI